MPCGMAASEEEPEAPSQRLDVARGLENVPVSAWPPGTEPEPFQVGGGARPAPAPFSRGRALPAARAARAASGVGLAPVHVGGGAGGSSALLPGLAVVLWAPLIPQVVSLFSTFFFFLMI